jgi:hypothetical protein
LLNALARKPTLELRRRIESLLALPTLVVRDVQALRDIKSSNTSPPRQPATFSRIWQPALRKLG